jgi:hypothetical protein
MGAVGEGDISHRVLLDRVIGELNALEANFALRFNHLDEGHTRLERRLDAVDSKLDQTRETVSELVGERRGEQQRGDRGPDPPAVLMRREALKRISIFGAIAIGSVTVLGGLSSAYQMAGRLIMAVGRAISAS